MSFADFVRAAGLVPGDILADGRWRRCKTESHPRKKNGSYKLAIDGQVGWCLDWAVHSEPLMWRTDETNLPAIDTAVIAKRRNEERRALVRATQAARRFYAECAPLRRGHPYLDSHGLTMTGCLGLRTDADGWLVIPAMLDDNIMSVQRISNEGDKKFWYGASVRGASYVIERQAASITVLCEGLATGLAIFASAPLTRIVVAFNTGNLSRVAIPVRGMAVVAADNDLQTAARLGHNPGLDAATEAAKAIGCGVAVPTGINGTDWCDYRIELMAQRVSHRPFARRQDLQQAVDAEIAAAMSRNARFLRQNNHAT